MSRLKVICAVALIISSSTLTGQGAPPGRIQLPGHGLPASVRLAPKGRFPAINQLQLAIGLPLRDEAGLDRFLAETYDPSSPNFRKYLTPQEFTARFGPTESDYAAVQEFVRTNGLKIISLHPNRLVLDVVGRVPDIERTFQVTLRTYRHPRENRDFYAPDAEPSTYVRLPIQSISGLDNFSLPRPKSTVKPLSAVSAARPLAGSGSGGSYLGNDFRAAYVPGTALTGSGQSVVLLQFDGYYLNDIASYLTTAGYPVSLTNVLANVPVNGGVSTPGTGNGEVCLDIEMVMAMAPGVSKIYVYEGPNGSTAWSTILSKIANDNLAKQVSCSWGATSAGAPDPTSESIFKQMAAQGMSFFNASGDSDAFVGGIPFPAESTNITQVGGTTLSTTGPGGARSSETAWNWDTSGQPGVGSSGGVSINYGIPDWQQGISMTANHGSTTKRNVPDVALTGDNVYVAYDNGSTGIYGGTSCAAPLWAGFMALANQQAASVASPPAGFINPAIYAIGKGSSYNDCFHDIASGDNYWTSSPTNFPAVTGFDLCTGWGTPNGTNLINALAPLVYFTAITNAAWTLLAESATPTNGVIDPGETVTVSFTLQNHGSLSAGNLVATLLPSSSVLAPSGPQSYGVLAALGGSSDRTFAFTAAGTCGSNIVATLQLQDGANNLGTVSFILPLGQVLGLTQNFDTVSAADLPSGWISRNILVATTNKCWVTTTASYDTSPISAFCPDSASLGQNALISAFFLVGGTNARLSFRHSYSFEYTGIRNKTCFDGGVLEIQIGNGTFTDIVTAGGSFVSGGYNRTITATSDNPLGGRSAWGGSSGGWTSVSVKLPASAAGKNVQLRWNCATDTDNANSTAVGWYVDSISITDAVPGCLSVFTDLAVSQSLAPNSLQAGQNLVYTLTVTNLGPQPSANVICTDAVPINVTFVSASPGCTYSNGQVVCPVGTLAAGVATNFTVTLAPAGGSVFTNNVSVGTVTPEISTANNDVLLIATQVVCIPAGISVGPTSQTLQCGGNATLSLVVTGTAPVSVQWWLDGVPVVGATNTSLLLTNLHMPGHLASVVVTNLYGNATSNAVLTVVDTLAPVVTLTGSNPFYLDLGSAFPDPGATAFDGCAGVVSVIVTGTVNPNIAGTNLLSYTADDGSGNTSTATRTVIVRDPVPIISGVVITGSGEVTLNLGGTPGRQYILETTEEFFPAIWLPVATNTLDASGAWQFADLQATNFLQRFYRLKLVP